MRVHNQQEIVTCVFPGKVAFSLLRMDESLSYMMAKKIYFHFFKLQLDKTFSIQMIFIFAENITGVLSFLGEN